MPPYVARTDYTAPYRLGNPPMPIVTMDELRETLPVGAILMGLDVGTKTIGVAVSDAGWAFAHPRPVIRRTKFGADWKALEAMIENEAVAALVVGLPLHLDGRLSPRGQAARAFASNVLARRDLPIAMWDERLSTVAAERAMIDADVSRAKRAERIDSAAAAFILQGALDRLVAD